jgi:hypothetical protein
MRMADWVRVGLKLLGVYFAASGVIALWGALLVVGAASGKQGSDQSVTGVVLLGLLRPLAELVVAYLLTQCTEQCLRWCRAAGPEFPPPADS